MTPSYVVLEDRGLGAECALYVNGRLFDHQIGWRAAWIEKASYVRKVPRKWTDHYSWPDNYEDDWPEIGAPYLPPDGFDRVLISREVRRSASRGL